MFNTFETAIDTQCDDIVTIEHFIHTDSGAVLYIVRDEEDRCYIIDEHHLIKYDKYYFDREEH